MKALRAAIRYVEALRACVRTDPSFRHIRPRNFETNVYLRSLAIAGLFEAVRFPPNGSLKFGASYDPRMAFLYFFRGNVSYNWTMRETVPGLRRVGDRFIPCDPAEHTRGWPFRPPSPARRRRRVSKRK